MPVRRHSKKISGRALTLPVTEYSEIEYRPQPYVDDGPDSLLSDTAAKLQPSQTVVYSDPEAAEQQRKVLASLSVKANEDPVIRESRSNSIAMRATGLDKQRRLRNT